ncbi:MAG: ArsR/SmtB family transcription factor [Geminicoccaceae bacterium]
MTASVFAVRQNAHAASRLLKALGNEHRLVIAQELLRGERSVGELVRIVGLSQSALSQHLARLRRDQLVRTRRDAQTIYYSLASAQAREVLELLMQLYAEPKGLHAVADDDEPIAAAG